MQRSRSQHWRRRFAVALAIAFTLFLVVPSASMAATTTINAANGQLQFNNTVKIGQDATVGFSTRYTNVFAGVDALVTVTAIQNTQLSNVDRVSTVNNDQLWTNLRIGSGGGYATYRVEFVETGKRDPVLLQNFSVNVGDIDAQQFAQFTGPTSWSLAPNTLLNTQGGPSTGIPAGAYRFYEANGTGADDSDTRFWAQVNYGAVSAVDVTLGAAIGGSALYQVSFGAASWGSTTPATLQPPVTQFTVSYDTNAGGVSGFGGSTASTTANSGASQTIQANGFTVPSGSNWAFVAWNTKADGSGVSYDPGDTIVPTTNLTLYAVWKDTSTTVVYYPNGAQTGSVPPSPNPLLAPGAQYEILDNSGGLIFDGYFFTGWNTRADGTGVFYLPGTLLNVVANTDLFAVWEPIPVVPSDSPIDIDVEPGQPIGGGEVNYVIPDQPGSPNCNPEVPGQAWSIEVTSLETGASTEIDAGCTPTDGDVFGTTVLPQDVPEGIYEVVYENTEGEKIVTYFEVGPNGTFEGQTNTDPRIAKTGSIQTNSLLPLGAGALAVLGVLIASVAALRRRTA